MSFILSILTFTAITTIAVLGVFMVTGLTGLFSFGQAAFMAIGAYASGVLVTKFHVPFPVAILIALVFGLVFGLLIGLSTIRLRRDYISLVTFGFGEAIIAILNNMASVTGGAMGLSGLPLYTTPAIAITSVIVCIIFARNFKYSKFGRQCIALRNDELAAKGMGINVDKIKLTAFLLSAVMTAYAGVLYGFYTTYVDPSIFGWNRSAEWIIIVFFGGINSLTGAVVSGLILGALPELLRFASEWRIVIYCTFVLLIINFRPQGLFGTYELNLKKLFQKKQQLDQVNKGVVSHE
jgi:branched-chain amino acid transport system permease protein